MTNATITAARTIDLSSIPLSQYRGDYTFPNAEGSARTYLNMGSLLVQLQGCMSDGGYRYQWRLFAAAIYNEAVIENDHHDALRLNNVYGARFPEISTGSVTIPTGALTLTPAQDGENRKAQALALLAMRRRETAAAAEATALQIRVRALQEQVSQLSAPITSGADNRLIEFWQIAADNADEAGFCPEYDRMAEMMDGVPRSTDAVVYVNVNLQIQVDVSGIRRSDFDDFSINDLRSHIDMSTLEDLAHNAVDWSNCEIDRVESD